MTDPERWHGLIILDGMNDPVTDPPLPDAYRPYLPDMIPGLRGDPTGAAVLREVRVDVAGVHPDRQVLRVGVSGALRDDQDVLIVQSVRHVYWTASGAYQLDTHASLNAAGALRAEVNAQRRDAFAVILSDLRNLSHPAVTDDVLTDGRVDRSPREGLRWLLGPVDVTPRARVLISGPSAPPATRIEAGLNAPHPDGAITLETRFAGRSALVHSVIVAPDAAMTVPVPVPGGAAALLVMAAFAWLDDAGNDNAEDDNPEPAAFLGACVVPLGADGRVLGETFTRTGPSRDARRQAALLDAAMRHVHLLAEYDGELTAPDTHVTHGLNCVRRINARPALTSAGPLRA